MEKPSDRLRQARIDAGFRSASAAARQFGWGDATYRHHENGTRGYSWEQAAKYAEAFKVDPAWLLDMTMQSRQHWRIPLGKFYTRVLAAELSYREEIDEVLTLAKARGVDLSYIPELMVSDNSIEVLRDENGEPVFHLISAATCGLSPAGFVDGSMFMMRMNDETAGAHVEAGDLVLIDSVPELLGGTPEIWLIRHNGRASCRRIMTGDGGGIIVLPDNLGGKSEILNG